VNGVTITNGLATIELDNRTAEILFSIMRSKIRTVIVGPNYKDVVNGNGPMKNVLRAIHIMSRMCYEIVSQNTEETIYLSNLSSEDIKLLYNLDKDTRLLYNPLNFEAIQSADKELGRFQNLLNEVRLVVRPAGPVDMLEADRLAKDLVTIMES